MLINNIKKFSTILKELMLKRWNVIKKIGFQVMDYFDHGPIVDCIIYVHLFQNLRLQLSERSSFFFRSLIF